MTVPLELVPAYLALYGLEPMSWDQPDTLKEKRIDVGVSGGWHE